MMTFLQFTGLWPKFLHDNYTSPFALAQPVFEKYSHKKSDTEREANSFGFAEKYAQNPAAMEVKVLIFSLYPGEDNERPANTHNGYMTMKHNSVATKEGILGKGGASF